MRVLGDAGRANIWTKHKTGRVQAGLGADRVASAPRDHDRAEKYAGIRRLARTRGRPPTS